MKKKSVRSSAPVRQTTTVLSPQEERVLRQIIQWSDEYLAFKASSPRSAYLEPPTTETCSEHFRYDHKDMLALLNCLEKDGLIEKRRRQSAGLSHNGYDGSLYSEVIPTQWGREVLARNS